MTHTDKIADLLNLNSAQVAAAIQLFDEGSTIPFVARYRKEKTGSLDEEQLRQIQSLLEKQRMVDKRRATILTSIEAQGKLNHDLRFRIESADSLAHLEDLYAPYKAKRHTRASIAREKGLQPLADLILRQFRAPETIENLTKKFFNEKVPTSEDALAGGRDIVAEMIADEPRVRSGVRAKALEFGVLRVEITPGASDERRLFEVYYDFQARLGRLRPHQVLAINRGEKEKVLRVKLIMDERSWLPVLQDIFRPDQLSLFKSQLELAIHDSAERLLLPAISRDIRRALTESSETHAIKVFGENLRALLRQPPMGGHTVLGIDPGFRTGCKLAVVDATGKVIITNTIYPHEPRKEWKDALETMGALVKNYRVSLIAIGNGTASRESEILTAELLAMSDSTLKDVRYVITNEAGASVYSASPLARAELPNLDVTLRGAVSIARRVQDPLAELIKIDPRSIGVGLYQHDVDQSELSRTLDGVIEDVVNWVGVDINTASPALLTHIAGIGPKMAKHLISYRDEHGPFKSREDLKKVPKFGEKTFEQAAGFLRVANSIELLDSTAIHPESYSIARALLNKLGIQSCDTPEESSQLLVLATARQTSELEILTKELRIGIPTLTDIIDQLVRPNRDPRKDFSGQVLRTDVLKMEDLTLGMRLKGTIRNVVDFGAFIDIAVKRDGLLHRSQIPPAMVFKTGDVIDVVVISIDIERGRIGLGLE